MTLETIAQTIDRLAQQELPSYEKPTRNMAGKTTHQITRRTTLNNNQVHYEVIAYSRGAQFAITDRRHYTRVEIPATANKDTITRLIASTHDVYRNTNN